MRETKWKAATHNSVVLLIIFQEMFVKLTAAWDTSVGACVSCPQLTCAWVRVRKRDAIAPQSLWKTIMKKKRRKKRIQLLRKKKKHDTQTRAHMHTNENVLFNAHTHTRTITLKKCTHAHTHASKFPCSAHTPHTTHYHAHKRAYAHTYTQHSLLKKNIHAACKRSCKCASLAGSSSLAACTHIHTITLTPRRCTHIHTTLAA